MGAPHHTTLAQRFWAKVDKREEDECWVWTASRKSGGYGQFFVGPEQGRKIGAHQFSWILHNGPIPDGLHVLHTCDNPPCVNPRHLFVGTQSDNFRDAIRKGRVDQRRGVTAHAAN